MWHDEEMHIEQLNAKSLLNMRNALTSPLWGVRPKWLALRVPKTWSIFEELHLASWPVARGKTPPWHQIHAYGC